MINLLESWTNPNQTFVIGDCESNGLNYITTDVWQLSYLIVRGGKIVKEVDDILDVPNFQISDATARINHFSWDRYNRDKRPIDEVFDRWDKNTKDAIIVGHNFINFDSPVIHNFRKRFNRRVDWPERMVDILALSKAYLTDRKNNTFNDWEEFMCWQYSCLSIYNRKLKSSQKAMLKHFGVQFDESKLHDALYDVRMNKEVFEKVLWKLKI